MIYMKKKNKWITVSKTTRNQECFINNIYLACRVDKLQHVFLTVMLYFRCKSFQKKINKRNGSTQAKPALARSIVRILKVVLRHRWMNHTHYSQLLDHRNPRIALPLTGLWSKISLKVNNGHVNREKIINREEVSSKTKVTFHIYKIYQQSESPWWRSSLILVVP